jgi:hypothetical protein
MTQQKGGRIAIERISPQQFARFVSFESKGKTYYAADETYVHSDGYLRCQCCDERLKWSNRNFHCVRAGHTKAKASFGARKDKQARIINDHQDYMTKNKIQGQTLDAATRAHRLNIESMLACANIPLTCVEHMEPTLRKMSQGLTSGGRQGLSDHIPFLCKQERDKVGAIYKQCYP